MFYKKSIRYLKQIIKGKKFLHDIVRYPRSLLRYLLRSKKINFTSIELGKHWQKGLIMDKGNNWRGGREQFIKSDNENYIRYGKNAKEFSEKFYWDKVIKKYLQLIN